jgi:hypothetical protein
MISVVSAGSLPSLDDIALDPSRAAPADRNVLIARCAAITGAFANTTADTSTNQRNLPATIRDSIGKSWCSHVLQADFPSHRK